MSEARIYERSVAFKSLVHAQTLVLIYFKNNPAKFPHGPI